MNKITIIFIIAFAFVIVSLTTCTVQRSEFEFGKTGQGYELTENGRPVFFYQQTPKTLTGEFICSNYIHPLYNLNGDVLTEEFPPDHPYHRGVFWTWHQIYIDTNSIGDGWINDGISQDVVKVLTDSKKGYAEINMDVMWKSSAFTDASPFMKEKSTIIVHPAESDLRKIDFTIELNSLVDKLEIGGSADAKGYGGFCVRLNIPDNMVFTSQKGIVSAQELQVSGGAWMDFSGGFGNGQEKCGLTILCHPDNPVFPSPWIIRQKGSMQNAVFPGRDRIRISMDVPVVLKYRLIIHNGDAQNLRIEELQAEYSGL